MPVEIQTLKQSQIKKKIKDLANMNKKFIIKLANENLTDAEMSVLGRGLKFVDVPKDPKAYMLDKDTEAFMRKMCIRSLMANEEGKRIHRFKPASSCHPLSTPSLDLENYLASTRLELSKAKIIL